MEICDWKHDQEDDGEAGATARPSDTEKPSPAKCGGQASSFTDPNKYVIIIVPTHGLG